jgi:hypothetical protein
MAMYVPQDAELPVYSPQDALLETLKLQQAAFERLQRRVNMTLNFTKDIAQEQRQDLKGVAKVIAKVNTTFADLTTKFENLNSSGEFKDSVIGGERCESKPFLCQSIMHILFHRTARFA